MAMLLGLGRLLIAVLVPSMLSEVIRAVECLWALVSVTLETWVGGSLGLVPDVSV
jgi:hypothetical protein